MKKIIIADDSRFMRKNLKAILKSGGFDVIAEAEDGEAVIELYKAFKPDLVTMDITMPKTSGIEALKEIIKFDNNAKVIICSSMGQTYYNERSS